MKKNILFIHDAMGGGGAERVLISILRKLDRSRFNVSLLLIYREGTFLPSVPEDIEILSLFKSYSDPFTRLITHFRPIRNLIRRIKVRRLLRNREFASIISFMEGPVAKLHSQILDLAPLNASWVHCNIRDGRWYNFWLLPDEEKELYRQMDRIAFVSDGAREAFDSIFTTDASRHIIPNPVDVATISANAGPERTNGNKKFRIVTAGRLIKEKRQDKLIRVAALLRDQGLDFIIEIYGVGALRQQLEDLISELKLQEYVKLMGFVKNPYPCIRQADVFCLTSESEGFGMVVAEALTVGTPVVSTRVNGVTDMLAKGGGILTGDTPEDIANALAKLINDPVLLQKLRDETAQSSQQFDDSVVMRQIEQFISEAPDARP